MQHFSSFLIGCAAALCMVAAPAAPITFGFTGAVTDDPGGTGSLGASISGSYSFDSLATDAIAGPSTGSFASLGAAFGFEAIVAGIRYAVQGRSTVNTADKIGVDQYGVLADDGLLRLELIFQDMTQTALASDALPLQPFSLASFGFRQFVLVDFRDDTQFIGSVTSLDCLAGCATQPLPEPGSLPLLALAMAALLRSRYFIPGLPGHIVRPSTQRRTS